MDYNINFPNLNIYLDHVGKNIMLGNFSIAYYGIVIALGMLAGITIASRQAKKVDLNPDDIFDLAIIAIVCSVLGARAYYVAFQWDYYSAHPASILNIREGGLAIYGGVLTAIVTVFIFAKVKKLSYGRLLDSCGCGLVLGQIIGRWGNFFNREAFGGYTDNLLAMQLPVSAVRSNEITAEQLANKVIIEGVEYIQVHPTFLYESLWNCGVLLLMLLFFEKKKFDGEIFLRYIFGYGVGRFWIEALRTDQLLIPGTQYPVSRVLAAVMVIVSAVWILIGRAIGGHKKKMEEAKAETAETE